MSAIVESTIPACPDEIQKGEKSGSVTTQAESAIDQMMVDDNIDGKSENIPDQSKTINSQSCAMKGESLPEKVSGNISDNSSEQTLECRACLQQLRVDQLMNLFQGWAPTWEGLQTTIAEELVNLSHVQLSETDLHSKFICYTCCEKLWNACHFKMLVQDNDRILRQRINDDNEKVWPKPIQVDKSINGVYNDCTSFNVDIKQEILSDDEPSNMDDGYTDCNLMEIKVEPEEIVSQPIINGVTSLKEFRAGELHLMNGETKTEGLCLQSVKEEPVSDNEDSELSLECLLCMRPFNSVSGLKAHVIAQHSYQTVGRRGDNSPHRTNDKHVCATCRRTFTTSTDLMVHETCHNQHACYGCSAKFDSFASLTQHRRRCKALASTEVKRPKTLDDVIRPQVEGASPKGEKSREINDVTNVTDQTKLFSCPLCNEIFSDKYYVKIHQEIHHSNEIHSRTDTESAPMEIEMLESIFNEET